MNIISVRTGFHRHRPDHAGALSGLGSERAAAGIAGNTLGGYRT